MPEPASASVLIVDDDQSLLRLMERTFKREGFSTTTAGSGKEAIAWLARNRATLMLLDLKLQDIEGGELISHLADIGRSVPFIIITGQGDERVAVEMMKRGALDYLVKDVKFIEFVPTAVRRALESLGKEKKLAAAQEARLEAERQLTADLDAMTRLQHLGTLFVCNGELEPILVEIVNAAMAIAEADFGGIQLVNAAGHLEIVAQRGFPPWWVEFWNNDSKGQGACSKALECGERIIVEDVERSPIFTGTPGLEILLRAGVRAVQSTPLVGRSGKLLGIFSTHYKASYRPDDRALRHLDLLARQAADIIERQKGEDALRESHERLKKVLAVETVGVMFWDLKTGCMTDANDTFLQLMGYNRREVEAGELTWQKLTPPEYLEASLTEIQKFLATGRVGPYEKEYFRKDGTRQWLIFAGSSLGDNACVEFCVDISARKQAERLLREKEAQLALITDITPVALTQCGRDLRYVFVNRAYAQMLDRAPGEIIGRTIVEIMGEKAFAVILPHVQKVLRGETVEYEAEVPFEGVHPHFLHVIYRPQKDELGEVVGWVASIADISGRKRLERELIDISERERRKFGHELHDGLGQMLTGLEMLSHALAEDLNEHAPKLAKQARRIRRELRETVTQVRIISQGLAPVPLEGDGLVRGLTALAESTNRIPGVACRFICGSPVSIQNAMTATHLYRIAQEAVNNALKHGQARKVDISLTERGGELELSVKNNGRVIPRSNGMSAGIGLNVMRYRAGIIGASLAIESGELEGARVTCTIRGNV